MPFVSDSGYLFSDFFFTLNFCIWDCVDLSNFDISVARFCTRAYRIFEKMVGAHCVRDEGGSTLHWLDGCV